jgi:hypothetical protein
VDTQCREFRVLGPLDIVLAALLIALAAAFIPYARAHGPCTLVVYRDNTAVARYPLGAEAEFVVRGAIGPLRIRIDQHGARVIHSTCPNRICMAAGAIRTPGQQIVCAPNHVLLLIVSRSQEAPDGISE